MKEGSPASVLNSHCKAAGSTAPDALRNLASEIDRRELPLWVHAAAKQYVEDGIAKAACAECGAIHEMSDFFEGYCVSFATTAAPA
jgi:hypothetical protein